MRILDRYLLGAFSRMFLGVLAACATIIVLTEVLDNFQDILGNDCPLGKALQYFVVFLPFRLVQTLPLVTVISILFSVGILAHNREMLSITVSGLSPYRVAAPIVGAGVAISLLTMAVAEFVVPHTETWARNLRKIHIEGKTDRIVKADIFRRGVGRRFYLLRSYDNFDHVMSYPTVIDVGEDSSRVMRRLVATTGTLVNEETAGGGTLWRLEGAIEYEFNESGLLTASTTYTQPLEVELEANLHTYLGLERKPEEMGALELMSYIHMLGAHGDPTDEYRTDLWLKVFFPFASLILIVAGFSFAMRAQIGSMVLGFAYGVLYALVFYAVVALAQAMGHRGVLSPFVAVMAPTVLAAALSLYLLKRSAYTMT